MAYMRKANELAEIRKITNQSIANRDKLSANRAAQLLPDKYSPGSFTADHSPNSTFRGPGSGITHQQAEEIEPGWMDKAGHAYNSATRPFAAFGFWGALETRKAITGNNEGVDEMREYMKARYKRSKDSLANRSIERNIKSLISPSLANRSIERNKRSEVFFDTPLIPLNKDEYTSLDNLWKNNTLPWGVLGTIEMVLDPINLLPMTFIAKSVGKLSIGAFKMGTQILARGPNGPLKRAAGRKLAEMRDTLTTGDTEMAEFAKKLGLEYTPTKELDDYYMSHTSSPLNPENVGSNFAEKLEVTSGATNKEISNISWHTTLGAKLGFVVQPTDTQGLIRTTRDSMIEKAGERGQQWFGKLSGIEKTAWDIDGKGNVRNVSLNLEKAKKVQLALENQDIGNKRAIRYIKDLIKAETANPGRKYHSSNVIENYNLFDYVETGKASLEGQLEFINQWKNMQNEVIGPNSILKKYLTPEDLINEKAMQTEFLYDVVVDGVNVQGRYFPHVGVARTDAETGRIAAFSGLISKGVQEPFFNRKTQEIIEDGYKKYASSKGVQYTKFSDSPSFAASAYYQGIAGTAAEVWYKKEYLNYLGTLSEEKLRKTIRELWTTQTNKRGKILKILKAVPTGLSGKFIAQIVKEPWDELNQNIVKTIKEKDDLFEVLDLIDSAKANIKLKELGIVQSQRLNISGVSTDTAQKAVARLTTEPKKAYDASIVKVREMKKAYRELTDYPDSIQNQEKFTSYSSTNLKIPKKLALIEPDIKAKASVQATARVANTQKVKAYTELLGNAIKKADIDHATIKATMENLKRARFIPKNLVQKGRTSTSDIVIGKDRFQDLTKLKTVTLASRVVGKNLGEASSDIDALQRLERAYPGMDLDILRQTKFGATKELPDGLDHLQSVVQTKLGTVTSTIRTQKKALKNRSKTSEIEIPNGGWINFGSSAVLKDVETGLKLGSESEAVGSLIKGIMDVNSTLRLSQTALDLGGFMINGLRLLTTPGGPESFRKLSVGLIFDIIRGKVDPNDWLLMKNSSETLFMRDAKIRANVRYEAVAEQLELFSTDMFEGVLGKKQVVKIAGKIVRAFEAIPEGRLSESFSLKDVLRYAKNVPTATIKAYSVASNFFVNEQFELMYRTIPEHVMKKMGVKSLKDIPENKLPEAQRLWRQAEQDLGDFANKSGGKLTREAGDWSLSAFTQNHQVMGAFLLFAPRFIASQISITTDLFRGRLKGNLARESSARLLGAATAFYIAACVVTDQEPKLDPRPKKDGGNGGDFFSFQAGPLNVALAGSANSLIKTIVQTGGQIRTGTLRAEQIKNPLDREENIFSRFIFNRVSPIVGTSLEIWDGRTYAGRAIDWGNSPLDVSVEVLKLMAADLLPFWGQTMRDLEVPNMASRSMGAGFEYMGLATYAASPWDMVSELRNQSTKDFYGDEFKAANGYFPIWDDLNSFQKMKVEQEFPEIVIAEENAKELWKDLTFSKIQEELNDYSAEVDEVHQNYDTEFDILVEKAVTMILSDAEMSAFDETWRDSRAFLYKTRSNSIKKIQSDHPDVLDFFLEQREEDKNIPLFDSIYQIYVDEIVYNSDLELHDLEGGYDFKQAELLKQRFINTYGAPIYGQISQMFELNSSTQHPLEREFRWGRQSPGVKKYWEAAYDIMDYYQIQYMRPIYDIYVKKKNSGDPLIRKEAILLEEDNPQIKMIAKKLTLVREQMRREDADLEHFLYKFGYLTTLLNTDNVERNTDPVYGGVPLSLQPINHEYPQWLIKAISYTAVKEDEELDTMK